MQVGNLVMCTQGCESDRGRVGLVMEAEADDGGVDGFWVEYFEDRESWKWYSEDERYMVEVISEYDE